MNQLFQQVRILNPSLGQDHRGDVWIKEGAIQAIATEGLPAPEGVSVVPGEHLILGPQLCDLHSHSGEPGHEYRETWDSLEASAIAGGFGDVAILPDLVPCIDRGEVVQTLRQQNAHRAVRFHYWGALTEGLAGEKLTPFQDLMASGVVGFCDGRSLENWSLVRRSLEYLQPTPPVIMIQALNRSLRGDGVMRDGVNSLLFGLPGDPVSSETTAIATVLELVAQTQTPIHIMGLSTARGVALVAQAQGEGLPVTASVTWLHLVANSDAIAHYDPNYRLSPPLGNPEDQAALIAGVKQGTISAIAIDHQGYSYEEKTVSFGEAPPGTLGLELALPLLWSRLVATQQLTPLELWRALSHGPRKILRLDPLDLTVGDRHFILFDPQMPWTVTPQTLRSLSQNTPWLHQEICGRVLT